MKIEVGKKYKARNGQTAAIAAYNAEANLDERFIGWIGRSYSAWTEDGRVDQDFPHATDLIEEAIQKRVFERWVVVNPSGSESLYRTKPCEEFIKDGGFLAVIHIQQEYQEGEGL